MPYTFQPKALYRMPTHFGPSVGPRQGPSGRRYMNVNVPKWTRYTVSFLGNREQLNNLVPLGFSVEEDEPIVTVQMEYLTEIPWLAGRGYNILGIGFPATFHGTVDHVIGDFLAVVWENLPDSILSGREELGFAKIYCELPPPRVHEELTHMSASWLGHQFFDMEISDLQPVQQTVAPGRRSEGLLHYKYVPKTGEWGEADVAYTTCTPFAPLQQGGTKVLEQWQGKGRLAFYQSSWEELPTLYHIVNTLAALEIKEYRGATMLKGYGSSDLSHQRILR